MAESCAWPDCRSHEVQAHMETIQCLSCGRHTNTKGQPVEFTILPEQRFWQVVSASDGVTVHDGGEPA